MKTFEIKNRFTNEVIFSHSCENNTIKITVEKAVEIGANLDDANLDDASLMGARLDGARLMDASLVDANLEDASLMGARLDGARLMDASLVDANLMGASLMGARLDGARLMDASLVDANLEDANLMGARLDGARLDGAKMPIFCKWSVTQTNFETIKIGCKQKTISEWDLFFASDEEFETERGTTEFIKIHANYEAMKTYVNFINANKL